MTRQIKSWETIKRKEHIEENSRKIWEIYHLEETSKSWKEQFQGNSRITTANFA